MAKFIHQRSNWPKLRWDQAALAAPLAAVRHRQGRFVGRMEALGFPRDDKLYLLVCAAYDASLKVCHEVHSMSCDGSNGRPERAE